MSVNKGIVLSNTLSNLRELFDFLDESEVTILPKEMAFQPASEWPDALQDLRGQMHHFIPVIMSPNSTKKVQKIVQLCQKHQISIIPQGGNTGRAGGALPSQRQHKEYSETKDASSRCSAVILSLSKMNQIIEYRKDAGTVTVGSGVVLDELNAFLIDQDGSFMFPIHMGSSSRAQIGGILSTNAGGMNALRYGTARHYCLGIEAVLPNGEIIDTLSPVYKNNIGPNIAQLLCGSEGIVGIMTKACLKLVPRTNDHDFMTIAAVIPGDKMTDMACFHHYMQKKYGIITDRLEIISIQALAASIETGMMHDMPIFVHDVVKDSVIDRDKAKNQDWLLIWRYEVPHFIHNHPMVMDELFNAVHHHLQSAIGKDAPVFMANTIAESKKIWKMRDDVVWAQKPIGYNIKHDIAVPIDVIGDFYKDVEQALSKKHPSALIFCFGHLGDGNLHFNVILPKRKGDDVTNIESMSVVYAEEEAEAQHITWIVDHFVRKHNGSISAEHGIGQANTQRLRRHISDAHYDMLQRLKTALDPENIMNPGKVLE